MGEIYDPLIRYVLNGEKQRFGNNIIALLVSVRYHEFGKEFMPPLDEGSVLFCP